MSEHALQISTAQFLRRALPTTAVMFHVPNGEYRDKRTAAKLKAYGVLPGVPDILVIYDGRLIGLELKAPKGRVSKEQTEVGEAFVANGMVWTVARSLEAVETFLRGEGVPLKATVIGGAL